MFWKLVEEFVTLGNGAYYQEKLEALATTHPECQRLMTIPSWPDHGDGAGGGGRRCGSIQEWPPVCRLVRAGAQAALHRWANTSLGDQRRGDSYVRKLLIHGARATLRWVKLKTDDRSDG